MEFSFTMFRLSPMLRLRLIQRNNELPGKTPKKRRFPRVNRELAASILENKEAEQETKDAEDNEAKKESKKKKGRLGSQILKDDRFSAMFQHPNFQIDQQSQEFIALHPVASPSTKQPPSLLEEHFEPVMEDDKKSDSDDASSTTENELEHEKARPNKKSKAPKLFEVKDEPHAEAFYNQVSLAKEEAFPLGERVKALDNKQKTSGLMKDLKSGAGGSREISFMAKSKVKYREDKEDDEEEEDGDVNGGRRQNGGGVESLGLKLVKISGGFRGRGRRGRPR